jgi:hypothetical protein
MQVTVYFGPFGPISRSFMENFAYFLTSHYFFQKSPIFKLNITTYKLYYRPAGKLHTFSHLFTYGNAPVDNSKMLITQQLYTNTNSFVSKLVFSIKYMKICFSNQFLINYKSKHKNSIINVCHLYQHVNDHLIFFSSSSIVHRLLPKTLEYTNYVYETCLKLKSEENV